MNMRSAQVNQMTTQLKDRVELLQQYYTTHSRDEIDEKTGLNVMYQDLITQEDQQFWRLLCRQDFRRLEKLLTQNIGEGHFLDDSDEF